MTADGVAGFVEELAADPPGPAAGSAAAVTVAMAAALVEMATRRSGLDGAAVAAAALRPRALRLADEDARAYEAVLESSGEIRRLALDNASGVLRKIGVLAVELDRLASPIVERVKGPLHSDVRAALDLANAARHVVDGLVAANRLDEDRGDWSLRRRADLPSGAVAWDVFGEGPPVVLVHGTPSWSYLWRNVAPMLARTSTVYVFDLPGYGDSPARRDSEISIASHARTLIELLDHWQVENAAVAGHDIGGAVVLRAHLLHRRPFRRLALLDAVVLAPWITTTTRHIRAHLDVYGTMPTHIFDRVTAGHLRTAAARGFDGESFDAYHRQWRGERGQAAYLDKVAQFDEAHTREFEPLLGELAVPVLVLWGAEDAWLDPTLAQRLGQVIPQATVTMVEGAGHFVMEDDPDAVSRALLDFLEA